MGRLTRQCHGCGGDVDQFECIAGRRMPAALRALQWTGKQENEVRLEAKSMPVGGDDKVVQVRQRVEHAG